jgi:hypothetical protein
MNILSLGLGVQSSTLYFMSHFGIIDPIDYAVFADPGAESEETKKFLEWILQWQFDNDAAPIIVADQKNLLKDILTAKNSTKNRFVSIPMFTKNENGQIGMLRRQCTNEYKLEVVDQAIRELYGLKKYARNLPTNVLIGISLDEIERMKISREKWKTLIYPLIKMRMTRMDCEKYLRDNKLPLPPKSACIFCPFQSDSRWIDKKENFPEEWDLCIKIDKIIRNSTKKGIKSPAFLHPSGKPLDKVDFKNEKQYKIFQTFKNECEGMCGN